MPDGARCQRYELNRAESVCGECYFCKSEMAAANQMAETRASTTTTAAEAAREIVEEADGKETLIDAWVRRDSSG